MDTVPNGGVLENTRPRSGGRGNRFLVGRAGASEGLGEWRAAEHLSGYAVGESGGESLPNAGKNPALGTQDTKEAAECKAQN